MLSHRKIRILPRSLSSSPPHNFSQSPDEESMQHINGALSPLHTRRGTQNDVIPTPDFAEFDILRGCPKLLALKNDDCQDVPVTFSELDKLQVELEQILVHTTDHQKKIYGEITFLNSGDYPSDDISNRPMPTFELKTSETFPSCSKEIEEEAIVEDSYADEEVDWLDESLDTWPPINLPQKFWIFTREYLDPVDEEYLQLWWSSIVQLFRIDHTSRSLLNPISIAVKKGVICDTNICEANISCFPSFSKYETHSSSRRSRFFLPNKNTFSSVKLKQFCNESLPPPTKTSRYELKTLSHSPTKIMPLVDGLINAYLSGNGNSNIFDNQHNALPTLDKRKSLTKKDSMSPVPLENGENEMKIDGVGINDIAGSAFPNGLINEENVTTSYGDILEMLNYALADYLHKFDEDSDEAGYDKETGENIEVGNVEDFVRRCTSDRKHENEDEVSTALKKLQMEISENETRWRSIVAKIWHRLLAEYLRVKLEQSLDKVDQEMFTVYDKYYSDYPKRRPANEREREECRCALERRNEAAQAYYGKRYAALGKWRRKRSYFTGI